MLRGQNISQCNLQENISSTPHPTPIKRSFPNRHNNSNTRILYTSAGWMDGWMCTSISAGCYTRVCVVATPAAGCIVSVISPSKREDTRGQGN